MCKRQFIICLKKNSICLSGVIVIAHDEFTNVSPLLQSLIWFSETVKKYEEEVAAKRANEEEELRRKQREEEEKKAKKRQQESDDAINNDFYEAYDKINFNIARSEPKYIDRDDSRNIDNINREHIDVDGVPYIKCADTYDRDPQAPAICALLILRQLSLRISR